MSNILKFSDGVEIELDNYGEPLDYEYLGHANYANQEIDWSGARKVAEFYNGSLEHWALPSEKKWFKVDCS